MSVTEKERLDRRKRERGWGPFKETWWTLCSRHRYYDTKCDICQAGVWQYNVATGFSQLLFKVSPNLWRWWVNG